VPALPAAALKSLKLSYESLAEQRGFSRTAVAVLVRSASDAGVDWRGAQDVQGNTHLMLAAAAPGDSTAALCSALVQAGINVEAVDKDAGDSALFLAARAGNLEVCKALIKAGADVLRRNNRNRTAGSQLKLQDGVRALLSAEEDLAKAARAERTKTLFDAKLRAMQTANACIVRAV